METLQSIVEREYRKLYGKIDVILQQIQLCSNHGRSVVTDAILERGVHVCLPLAIECSEPSEDGTVLQKTLYGLLKSGDYPPIETDTLLGHALYCVWYLCDRYFEEGRVEDLYAYVRKQLATCVVREIEKEQGEYRYYCRRWILAEHIEHGLPASKSDYHALLKKISTVKDMQAYFPFMGRSTFYSLISSHQP